MLEAIIKTNKGNIYLDLFCDKAPLTVANFYILSKEKFYDSIIFHRVIKDFMIQTGDPTGTGYGGPGYSFEDEFVKGLIFDKKGLLAMANAGPNTNGSQFFITHVETEWLNYKHTIFGQVKDEKSQEIVDNIEQNDNIINIEILGDIEEYENKYSKYIEKIRGMLS